VSRAEVFVERVPRPELVTLFLGGGALASVAGQVRDSGGLLDLDFWVDSRANLERASVYCGLAKLVDIYSGSDRRLRLEPSALVRRRLPMPDQWVAWVDEEAHAELGAYVVSLVDRLVPLIPPSHLKAGSVLRADRGRAVLARSFGPRLDRDSVEAVRLASVNTQVRDALRDVPGVPPNLPMKHSCDALMVDQGGNFLLVDAEAARSAEIGFSPARAVQNLALWDAWIANDPAALPQLKVVASLRESLGLCPVGTSVLVPLSGTPGSTFVLATEAGVSPALVERMQQTQAALTTAALLDPTRFRSEVTPDS
jgi:hypothetical protein